MNAPGPDQGFDETTGRALDSFTVPALRAEFADRVVAQAVASRTAPNSGSPPVARGAAGRRRWQRRGIAAIAVSTLGLVSAAAAATGMFGSAVRDVARRVTDDVPVIGRLIAQADPAPRPARAIKPAAPPLTTAEPATEPAAIAPIPQASLDPDFTPAPIDAREAERTLRRTVRQARAQRAIADRVDARIAASPRLQALSPEAREAIAQQMRERAMAKFEARQNAAAGGEGATPAERRRQRWQSLPPEIRDTMVRQRQERAAARQAAAPPVAAGPSDTALPGNRARRWQELPPETRAVLRERWQARRKALTPPAPQTDAAINEAAPAIPPSTPPE